MELVKKLILISMLSVHTMLLCAQSVYLQPVRDFRRPMVKDPEHKMIFRSPKDTLSVFVIGDIMMHTPQMDYDCHEFLRRIEYRMRAADLCIVNMEFTTAGEPYTGYPCFSAPDVYAWDMADKGADVFLMANNHILDKGSRGLLRTLELYDRIQDSLGVLHTGVGLEPLSLVRKGFGISLINFTYGTNNPQKGDIQVNRMDGEMLDGIFAKVPESSDFTIVLPHWGAEYVLTHSATQQKWAEWLVGKGADAIVGGHPHVPQDSTHINGVPVIYSMGNAVSNMSHPNTQLELAVTLRFVSDRLTGEKSMLEPEIDFMWCSRPGGLSDNYSVIFVSDWIGRRDEWKRPSDYDNMVATLLRVCEETGLRASFQISLH